MCMSSHNYMQCVGYFQRESINGYFAKPYFFDSNKI